MSGNVTWTCENDKQLTEFIKNHEALYNIKLKEYKQALLCDSIHNQITLGLSENIA